MVYSEMACTGQVAMHAPQSMHTLSSHSAFPSTMLRALTGHTSTHAPQPMQVSLSILTAMVCLLNVLCYHVNCLILVKLNLFLSFKLLPLLGLPRLLELLRPRLHRQDNNSLWVRAAHQIRKPKGCQWGYSGLRYRHH